MTASDPDQLDAGAEGLATSVLVEEAHSALGRAADGSPVSDRGSPDVVFHLPGHEAVRVGVSVTARDGNGWSVSEFVHPVLPDFCGR